MLNIWTHIRPKKWWWREGIFKWRYFNQCHRRERFQVDEEVVRWSIIEEREWENKKFNWMFREYREFIIQISFGERWVARRVSAQTMSSLKIGERWRPIFRRNVKNNSRFFLEFQIFSFVQIVKIFKSRTSLKTTSMLPTSALRWQRKQWLFWRREDALKVKIRRQLLWAFDGGEDEHLT